MKRVRAIGDSVSESPPATTDGKTSQGSSSATEPNATRETDKRAEVLRVDGIQELTAADSRQVRERVLAALNGHKVIEVDLSETRVMDCGGLGALIALRNVTGERRGKVCLLNPRPPVERLLNLLHGERLFEIAATRSGRQ